jgi:hypothetical protein
LGSRIADGFARTVSDDRLILILLGVDYLRQRSVRDVRAGLRVRARGLVLLVDSLGSYGYFPLRIFAGLLAVAGVCALAMAAVSSGAMRIGRIIEGIVFVLAASLVMAGHHGGDFWLAMILGSLFALDGLLQCLSAVIVRYPRWRLALLGGLCEIAIAVSFFSPYPFGYEGTVPYALSLALLFVGWGMIWIAVRMRLLGRDATVGQLLRGALYQRPDVDGQGASAAGKGPMVADPAPDVEPAINVYVWAPANAARQIPLQRRPLIDRYIAAVDAHGVVWTGHVALEASPVYISLDPAAPIKRSLDELRMLHAAPYNNVPGYFQVDYVTDAKLRGSSTQQIRIRNFDVERLQHRALPPDTTYNLTRRCAASVAGAGSGPRRSGQSSAWQPRLGLVHDALADARAVDRRPDPQARAKTMAWTPGLVLDYSRALSILVDPAAGWYRISATARRQIRRIRRGHVEHRA